MASLDSINLVLTEKQKRALVESCAYPREHVLLPGKAGGRRRSRRYIISERELTFQPRYSDVLEWVSACCAMPIPRSADVLSCRAFGGLVEFLVCHDSFAQVPPSDTPPEFYSLAAESIRRARDADVNAPYQATSFLSANEARAAEWLASHVASIATVAPPLMAATAKSPVKKCPECRGKGYIELATSRSPCSLGCRPGV